MTRLADSEADVRESLIGHDIREELAQLFERVGLQRLQSGIHSPRSGGARAACARARQRVLRCSSTGASSKPGAGFHPALRCSATTLVKIPPRTWKRAVRRRNRGASSLTRSSQIRFVIASWKAPSLRNDPM